MVLTEDVELCALTGQRYPGGDVGGNALELSDVFGGVHSRDVQVAAHLEPASGVGQGIAVQRPVEHHVLAVGHAALERHALTLPDILVLRVRLEVIAILAGAGREQEQQTCERQRNVSQISEQKLYKNFHVSQYHLKTFVNTLINNIF